MKEDNKDLKETKEAKEVRNEKGLVNVTYLKDHGTNKKGSTAVMHSSTAKALEAHKVVKVGEKVTSVKITK